jgi:putative endopeptidase
MRHRIVKPLVLAIGLGLAGIAAASVNFDVSELSPDINPCQDFNGYVNAKWVAAHPIPADETRWGSFNELHEKSLAEQHQIAEGAAKNSAAEKPGSIEQKIGRLYAAGMDEAAIDKAGYDPIKPRLAQIAALKNSAGIAQFLDASFNEGDSYVFNFGSSADFHDASKQIGYVFQGGLGLPTRDYYLKPEHKDLRTAYVAYIAKSFELTGTPAAAAKTQADSVLAFETELAKASLSPTERRNVDNQYHFVSVAEADKVSPHFSWDKFFAAQGVEVSKGFSLSQPKFIAEFDKLLATAPVAQWQAYLRFHTISSASTALGKTFEDNHFDFYNKTLSGQPEQKDRWKRVLGEVNGAMGMGMGELYVAKYFPPESKQRAEQLVTNVRNALKNRIEHLDWMSAETKQKAIDKWNAFLPKIGYPDAGEWRDWSGLTIEPGNWFANLQAASKYNYHYDVGKIGKATDRKEWGMTPQTVNAYYSPTTNTINFPAAILQPPFFFATGDDALNYGGIGAVIGHEASHGFDDQGSQFDGSGNRVNWWTKQDKTQFDARTDKLVKQFDAYAPIKEKPALHINGKLTLGENIADLGGINIAYDALQTALKADSKEADAKIDGMTEDQRFFLGFARVWRTAAREKTVELLLNTDPHSPGSVRAFAAPSNMPQFAQAFSCKAGDPMVRGEATQVKIW